MQIDECVWLKSHKRKTLSIEIKPDASVCVRTPYGCSKRRVQAFLDEKSSWIEAKRAAAKDRIHPHIEELYRGMRLFFKGRAYKAELRTSQKASVFIEGELIVIEAKNDALRFKALMRFYKEATQKRVLFYLHKHQEAFSVTYSGVTFRRYKRRWGSCSRAWHLSFNSMLSVLAEHFIEYVVVHELVHLEHQHHQKAFYQRGEAVLEGFKDLDRALNRASV